MKKPYIELKPYTAKDMVEGIPEVFDTDVDNHASLLLCSPYGFLFPYGDSSKKPIWYLRNANPNSYRYAGFSIPGDGFQATQTCLHHGEVADKTTKMTTVYQKLSDCPLCYGYRSDQPYCEFELYENYSVWKETNLLDVKAIPLPFAVFDHNVTFPGLSQIMQPCIISGFYEGKPVCGMGNWDRLFRSLDDKRTIFEMLSYILSYGHGIREDGRMETFLISIQENGNSHGIYWLEGEEPVMSEHVKIKTVWSHLDHCDDGTSAFEDAIYSFGGKEIHYFGKWGTKGITPEPRYDRPGQFETFGKWYEGKTSYKHKLFFGIVEGIGTFDFKLKNFVDYNETVK